jgi:hypothetical protein
VNCDAARDLLPEHALGVSGVKARAIAEHLGWCAACRKESQDLQRASATLAFALAPTASPDDLEDAVVHAIRTAAGSAPAQAPRRPRRALTLVLAATLALAGLGGGAVLATRDPGPTGGPDAAAQRREDGLNAWLRFVAATRVVDGETQAFLAVLMPADGGPGGGSAMAIVSPSVRDRAIVVANGLAEDDAALPYTAWLADAEGSFVKVGTVRALTTNGGFTVGRIVKGDLSRYVNVLVRSARGKIVLAGTLTSDTSIPTPAP